MQKTLRPYQQEVIDKIKQRWKETTYPLLVNASVGAGKSLIISELLLVIERAGYRGLCITMNSTLIQQNAHSYNLQNGDAGIYCAGLKSKCFEKSIIFGSPHSILQGIRDEEEIGRKKFNIIIIDECHQIAPHNPSSMFMRILNHYGLMAQQEQYSFRILGLTGTPYRDKAVSIVGKNELFKEQVSNISTHWLIENKYLTKPCFGLTQAEQIDFSQCNVDSFGRFNQKELDRAIAKDERLTGKIMLELQTIIENGRKGCFIFASTKKHCDECSKSLPDGQWAIVTGDTSHQERKKILEDAANGKIKYLINVNVLTTGVDLPLFDVCAWLRPTESLILFVQGIGRILRLHTGKTSAIILDYAGNLQRHGDIDDPIINEAIQPKEKDDPDFCIPCFSCSTFNTIHSRRCIGIINNSRCNHYFEFKECSCGTQNDITSRECRSCGKELIDPNAKLKRLTRQTQELIVLNVTYEASCLGYTSTPIIKIKYVCVGGKTIYENYLTNTERARQITYNKFIKLHCEKPSKHYRHMMNIYAMKAMLDEDTLKTPHTLICSVTDYNRLSISKKLFHE